MQTVECFIFIKLKPQRLYAGLFFADAQLRKCLGLSGPVSTIYLQVEGNLLGHISIYGELGRRLEEAEGLAIEGEKSGCKLSPTPSSSASAVKWKSKIR